MKDECKFVIKRSSDWFDCTTIEPRGPKATGMSCIGGDLFVCPTKADQAKCRYATEGTVGKGGIEMISGEPFKQCNTDITKIARVVKNLIWVYMDDEDTHDEVLDSLVFELTPYAITHVQDLKEVNKDEETRD